MSSARLEVLRTHVFIAAESYRRQQEARVSEREAEVEILRAALAIVRPVRQQIVGKVPLAQHWRAGDTAAGITETVWYERTAVVIVDHSRAVGDAGGGTDATTGTYSGSCLYLADNGKLLCSTEHGRWHKSVEVIRQRTIDVIRRREATEIFGLGAILQGLERVVVGQVARKVAAERSDRRAAELRRLLEGEAAADLHRIKLVERRDACTGHLVDAAEALLLHGKRAEAELKKAVQAVRKANDALRALEAQESFRLTERSK